jgi:hypothetical protein
MNKSRKKMRTIEKQMKNQRRNNEKQWKTKDNYASILNYFFAFFFFVPVFSSFPSSMGKEIRDNFEEKTCLEASWRLSVHKTP